MSLLLTGASGFLGRSVQNALRLDNIPYQIYEGDISDFVRLRDALVDIDTVIHLAGAESRGRRRALQRIDINGSATLIKALRHRPVKQTIIVSRLHANPNSIYHLLRARGMVEQMWQQSGLPVTTLRSATLFGKDDRFTNGIAATAAWSWPFVLLPSGGETALQPLWVEDAARCIVACIGRTDFIGRTIEIAGDERLHYREVVRLVLTAARLRRRPLALRPQITRNINRATTWMFYRPMRHRYDLDRLAHGEVTVLNTIPNQFGFRPARLHSHLSHLRRGGNFRRLWRG